MYTVQDETLHKTFLTIHVSPKPAKSVSDLWANFLGSDTAATMGLTLY